MSGFILGKKTKQSQMFDDSGARIPVTSIETSSCYLVDVKTSKNDTQDIVSIKLGFGKVKSSNKPKRGQIEKAGIKSPLRFLREFSTSKYNIDAKFIEEEGKRGFKLGDNKIFVGNEVSPTFLFKKSDLVSVSGTSKGKGFQGVVRRHAFAGGPKTHGQSNRHRAPGSMGQTTTPGRVYRGKRMAGRVGGERVTVQNLPIVNVSENSILVKGLIPGNRGEVVEVVSRIV